MGNSACFGGELRTTVRDPKKKYNILVIVVDEERSWGSLPHGFSVEKELPNRCRLLKESVNFPNFRIVGSPCEPSRACLYTGMHFQGHGVYCNKNVLPETFPTVGNMMRDAGQYYCVYKGKWHMDEALTARLETMWPDQARELIHQRGVEDRPTDTYAEIKAASEACYEENSRWRALEPHGFSEWNRHGDFWGAPQEGYEHDPIFTQEAVDWIRDHRSSGHSHPWFMALNLINPHDIMFYNASERQASTRQWPMPEGRPLLGPPDDPMYKKKWNLQPRTPGHLPDGKHGSLPPIVDRADTQFHHMFGEMGKEEFSSACDYYVNCLRDSDRHIGTVLDALEHSGYADDTVVILTSDHGDMLGDHGLRMKGPYVYKGHLNVPFMIRMPGVTPSVCDAAVCSIDVTPTILSLGGVKDWAQKYPFLKGVDATASLQNLPDRRKHEDPDLDGFSIFQFAKPGRKPGQGKGKKGKGKGKGKKGAEGEGAAEDGENAGKGEGVCGGEGEGEKGKTGEKGKKGEKGCSKGDQELGKTDRPDADCQDLPPPCPSTVENLVDDGRTHKGHGKGKLKAKGQLNNEARMCMQALVTNRWKFAKCFNIFEHADNGPEKEFDDLLKTCDLILYDMLNDPDERTNLLAGNDPSELEEYKGLIIKLNHFLRLTVEAETIYDQGHWQYGCRVGRRAPWHLLEDAAAPPTRHVALRNSFKSPEQVEAIVQRSEDLRLSATSDSFSEIVSELSMGRRGSLGQTGTIQRARLSTGPHMTYGSGLDNMYTPVCNER